MPKPSWFPYQVESDRLVLRCYALDDAQALFEAVEQSRAELSHWLPWATSLLSVDETQSSVRRFRGEYDMMQDFKLGIFRKDDGLLLGGTGLHRFDWQLGRFEIGYWLRTSETGKGYVTETAARLTRFAFEELNANRVEIFVDTANHASRAVPERLGFPLEGIARNAMWAHEKPRDRAIYAMIPKDFTARKWAPGL